MNFEQLTKAMNEQFVIVTDTEEAGIICSGDLSHLVKTNMARALKDKKVLIFKQFTEQDLVEWGLDPEIEACFIVVDL
jgi:hypothetical protein|nr:MAG TPA: hypothetical protein [Caudoviricetes sp.]